MQQESCEERGGVLHTQAKLRQRNGCACRTICRLMPKSAASEPAALSEPLPNGPAAKAAEGEAAPAPPTPRQGPLEAIAEEGAAQQAQQAEQAQQLEQQPPTPPDSPRSPRQQPGGIWGQLVRGCWVVQMQQLFLCMQCPVPVLLTPGCPLNGCSTGANRTPPLLTPPHCRPRCWAGSGAAPWSTLCPASHWPAQHQAAAHPPPRPRGEAAPACAAPCATQVAPSRSYWIGQPAGMQSRWPAAAAAGHSAAAGGSFRRQPAAGRLQSTRRRGATQRRLARPPQDRSVTTQPLLKTLLQTQTFFLVAFSQAAFSMLPCS